MTLITCTGIAISSTNSNAIETNDTPSQVSTPVSLSNSQTRSLASAYNWLDRDSSIFSGSITPQQIFVEYQGLKERSEYLNVKVKTRVQMIEQFSREAARLNTPSTSASQTRGAAINQVVAFETRLADADRRIIEARSRLAPSLREAYNDIDMHSIKIPEGLSAEVAAEALMQTGDYEYVSMDWICYPTDTSPNDSLFNTQWHHAAARIDSVGAWDYTQGDPGTIIGVCDSGVDLDHPDLAAALVPGYNSVNNLAQVDGGNVNDDLNGHGTLVAGSAAAIGNNGTGVAGVGWNFGIMPIRVSNLANGTALLSEILEGARWASDNGAYTANCSFGGAEDSATRSTGGHIRAEGHLLVFAAGNDGLANQTNDWTGVTIVGASNQSDNWASFSHTGIGIDCIAPGVSIRSTNRTGGYSFTTGTSFSAPITAGAMMLIHDANPALTANEVEFMLLNTCDDKQALGEDNQTGWGRINVQRAVEDAIFGPSITSLPFEDTFPDDTLPTQWRNPVGDVDVSMDAVGTPSGAYSLNLDDQDSIESIEIRASALLGEIGEIHFSVEHRGVEAGENLVVEYFDILNSWSTLTTITSDGVDEDEFSQHRFLFPAFGLHENFKLRFVANGSDTSDDWYIDDVAVIQFENNSLPWEDNFEDGITLILDWESSTATASSDAMNAPDGPTSALLNNQDSMTSTDVDVSTSLEVLYYRFYTQHQGVESDETLTVEYKNVLGNWNPLMTITSDGNDQSTFTLQQVAFPFDAYGATSALRLTANGDESDDSWFVDSVAITPEFVVEVPPCPQDINEDGTLNFFDISAFLSAFSALDPVADFNNDGTFNFFDISTFLSAFSAGCP
ncbi:MAG: S8 family serine peptidase [Phycisphaerales bacterium]|nr:S8 family serine peptidase [Phycisphaerales bacterium]